jgi:hypothetical protein
MSNYWIVICPVDRIQTGNDVVRDLLWDRWYTQHCVAIGFPPAEKYAFDGPSQERKHKGWANARNCLSSNSRLPLLISGFLVLRSSGTLARLPFWGISMVSHWTRILLGTSNYTKALA